MRYYQTTSIHSSTYSNGVPCACVADIAGFQETPTCAGRRPGPGGPCPCMPDDCRPFPPRPPFPPCPPLPPYPPYPPYPPFPPFPPPGPEIVPYTINYYVNSIAPDNLVGTVNGSGYIGSPIMADLTLFAPAGYQIPGTRSGAEYISAMPANNVVNVVYSPQLLDWTINYYAGEVLPANLIISTNMAPVPYGTVITLDATQLNAYQPGAGYGNGEQVGGPVAITMEGQVINVLYPAV